MTFGEPPRKSVGRSWPLFVHDRIALAICAMPVRSPDREETSVPAVELAFCKYLCKNELVKSKYAGIRPMRQRHRKSDCPIHFALEIFGDAWTLLIIRDLMFKGRISYTDFLNAEEGIATNVLADRLVRLEEDGIIQKEAGSGRGTGSRYWLTSKGIDLLPVLLEIIAWSAKHDPKTAADPKFVRQLRADSAAMKAQIRKRLLKHSADMEQAEQQRRSARRSSHNRNS